MIKIGTGSLTLSGYYTYINGTTISGGTLQLGNINALGTGGLTANGGVLDLSGNGISVPSFNGAGGVVTNSAVGTLAASPSANRQAPRLAARLMITPVKSPWT